MTRRKGERPLVPVHQPYDATHPVARSIASGTSWFAAWRHQYATPYPVLVKRTRLSLDRISALDRGAVPTAEEIAVLAVAWDTTPDALLKSRQDCP